MGMVVVVGGVEDVTKENSPLFRRFCQTWSDLVISSGLHHGGGGGGNNARGEGVPLRHWRGTGSDLPPSLPCGHWSFVVLRGPMLFCVLIYCIFAFLHEISKIET